GIVSVGFLVDEVDSVTFLKILKVVSASSVALVFSIIGGILLARNIRKETIGLEPHEIASLYRDRNAILSSVKEGIIAMDKYGHINMINESARAILGLPMNYYSWKIEDIFPNTKMYEVLQSGAIVKDDEMILNNRHVIVNRTPIIENEKVIGVVASFRDRTEMNETINALSEVR